MSYGTPPPTPGYGAPAYGPPPPNHPRAVTILVLGILSLVLCGFLGIPAWVMGNRVLREIDSSGGAIGGRGQVQAGRVCGIIATVLLVVSVVLLAGLFTLLVVGSVSSSTSGGSGREPGPGRRVAEDREDRGRDRADRPQHALATG